MVRIIQNYTLYQVIGEGAYGKVYRAINKVDNKQYAVKVIQVKKFQTNKKLQQCTVHQINILTNIQKNNHIISYFDMLKTQNNFYFVYQYCNGGTLQGMLSKNNTLDEQAALQIFKQLLDAFQVLNKYNIMHRDLKPDNIFFHNNVVKVGDFGFCKSLQKAQMTKTMLGSPIYMAPQILNGQIYSNKADIWSLGVVLYQMLYGYCPFQSSSIPKLIQVLKQTQLQFPSQINVSQNTKNLLRRILTKDPTKRIQWMQLFRHGANGNNQSINSLKFGARQIVQTNDDLVSVPINANSKIVGRRQSQTQQNSNNNYSSPRNSLPMQTQPTMMKKNQGVVQQAQSIPRNSGNFSQSPLRKNKTIDQNPTQNNFNYNGNNIINNSSNISSNSTNISNNSSNINNNFNNNFNSNPNNNHNNFLNNGSNINPNINYPKISKFHSDMKRGINIVRSMALGGEQNVPLFMVHLLKFISQKMKKFRQQQLMNPQAKVYKQCFDQQIDDIDYQLAMTSNKVQNFGDWKKAIKSKILQTKNTILLYQLVMFLSNQPSQPMISPSQMKYIIKTKTN